MDRVMTSPTRASRHRPLTLRDEMSLADERSTQAPEAEPDTLEVGDDSMVILQGAMGDLRRPLLIAGAVAGTTVGLAMGLAALIRALRGSESTTEVRTP
jgi:hypothetical protein